MKLFLYSQYLIKIIQQVFKQKQNQHKSQQYYIWNFVLIITCYISINSQIIVNLLPNSIFHYSIFILPTYFIYTHKSSYSQSFISLMLKNINRNLSTLIISSSIIITTQFMRICLLLLILLITISCTDYRVTNSHNNLSHIVLNLQYTGSDDFYIKQSSTIYKNLNFTLACHSFSDLSFTITDFNGTRFRIPKTPPFSADPLARSTFPLNLSAFLVNYTTNPFNFKIIRRTDNQLLFDSSVGNLTFSKYYIQISTRVASKNVWGFGQRFSNRFRLQTGKYSIFNRDRGQVVDKQQGLQTYGHYPIYLLRDNSSNFHINYFRNSNAMDVIVSNDSSTDGYVFTYKTIGGMIDFRFVLGTTSPQQTIQRFHIFLGRSAVPPFWALGFHQCRWGYESVDYLENVTTAYKNNDIPLDTIWSDIDYMIQKQDFTINEQKFNLTRMSNILKEYHYIPIVDAGIKVGNGTAYLEGVKRGVFVKDAVGNELHGKVWPGTTTFVDFFHPNATSYWEDMLNILYSKVKFSGVWLDMNELANFCDGPCNTPNNTGFDYSNDLPYNPGADGIESHTISLNSTRYGNLTEADVHAYSGLLTMYATHQFLAGKNVRPFIISRSTAPGAGVHGFHWTGDNYAGFDFLRNSIAENFMFQIWGIQMVGADICGFGGNTTEQLCARWFQLGSLYPFARNHNDNEGISQQAYALGDNVLRASRTNLKLRYSLLKNFYRHFVVRRGIGSVFQPLFFNFPKDNEVYSDEVSETQFMLGKQLMAAPVVEKGATGRQVYFPGNFYDFYTGIYIKKSKAQVQNLMTDPIPLYIQEGFGVFIQNVSGVTKTSQLDNHFEFRAGLRYLENASTGSVKRYSAQAFLLGIKNYNDESKISLCIYEGCQYEMIWTLQVHTNGVKTLDLETYYEGGAKLNQTQVITSITLYYNGSTLIHKFASGIQISKTGRQTFTLNGSNQEEIAEE